MTKQTIHGFTLLELVLVLFLMGLLASVAVTFVENEDSQQRYDSSLRTINQLQRAVIHQSFDGNQPLLSGYIVDNGILPAIPVTDYKVEPLHTINALQPYAEKEPYYHYNGGTQSLRVVDTANNLSEELTLFKGFRKSLAFASILDSNTEVRDAWGTHFGVTTTANDYTITLTQHAPLVTSDRDFTLDTANWSIPVTALNSAGLSIDNQTGADITNTAGFYVALLVYQNNVTSGEAEWITYRSAPIASPIVTGVTAISLQDQIIGGTTPSDVAIDGTMRIAVGTHLLVLIDNDRVATAIEGDVVFDNTGRVHKKFTLFPGITLPALTLEVR